MKTQQELMQAYWCTGGTVDMVKEYNKADRYGDLPDQNLGNGIVISSEKIWKEVKE